LKVARNPNAKDCNEKARSISLMKGLMPVLVQSGLGAWAGFHISSGAAGLSNTSVRFGIMLN